MDFARNTKAFDHVQIVPRSLTDMENPSTETSVYGIPMKMPIMMSPAAAQGLAHARGEMATVEGMAAAGTIMAQSTYGNTTIADTARAGKGASQFFQLYMSKDWNFNKALLNEAVQAGIKAIILTVDATVGGYREADRINNFQFPCLWLILKDTPVLMVKARVSARFTQQRLRKLALMM